MRRPERLLLDTHVWLWFSLGTPKKIPPAVVQVLEEAGKANALMVSIVSIWELALLVARDRVVLPLPLGDWITLSLSRPEIRLVGLTRPAAVLDSVFLPGEIHSDPADRFLIATARSYRARLATRDEKIIAYGRAGHIKVLEV